MNEKTGTDGFNPYAKGTPNGESPENKNGGKKNKNSVVSKIVIAVTILLCLVLSTFFAVKIIKNNQTQKPSLESDGKYVYLKTDDGLGYELRGYVAKDDGSFVLPYTNYPFGKIPEPIDQSEVLVLPSEFNNLPVTEINYGVFRNHMSVTEIVLPKNLKIINYNAFKDCYAIKTVNFPKSVEKVLPSAFELCPNIESITVENGGEYYFSENNCLIETKTGALVLGCKNSVIPSGGKVKTISSYAFSRRKGLESIVIPEGVTAIEDYAFNECSDLKSVSVPDSLTFFSEGAFNYTAVTSTEINGELYYGNEKNPFVVLVHAKDDAIYSVKNSTRIIMPSAFGSELKEVTVPENVVNIAPAAFLECSALEKITIDKNNEFYYGENCLIEKNTCTLLRVTKSGFIPPEADIRIIDRAFAYCSVLESATIPEGVEFIDTLTFNYCTSLKTLNLPRSLKKLGDNVFLHCDNLKTINFAGKVAEWNGIKKYSHWANGSKVEKVICSDGEVDVLQE